MRRNLCFEMDRAVAVGGGGCGGGDFRAKESVGVKGKDSGGWLKV